MARLTNCHRLLLLIVFVVTIDLPVAPALAACPSGTCIYLPAINAPSPVVLPNHSTFSTSSYLHIVGEVYNPSGQSLEFVQVSADVFNGAQLVATDTAYITLDVLPPGDKTCFDILVQKPAAWTSYQFEPVSASAATSHVPRLAVLGPSGAVGSFGSYHIIGQVRNDEATTVKYVEPIGTLYNAAGTVLDCDLTFVNSTDLNSGQTSAFDMLFLSRASYADVASFRVQVTGTMP